MGWFMEIQNLRKNVYDLVVYLNQERIFHVPAHLLFDLNHRLSLDYLEKMLRITGFEINGSWMLIRVRFSNPFYNP